MNTSLIARAVPSPARFCASSGLAVALAASLLAPAPSSAATVTPILAYGFDQGELFRSTPDRLATGVSAGAWVAAGGGATATTGNPGRALSANGWQDAGNAFVLRVNLAPGHTLDLTGFGFDERASGTGATGWELSIAEVLVATGSTHAAFTRHAGLVALPGPLSGQFDVVLRGFGASSGSGTWRLDNFFLEGEVLSAGGAPVDAVSAVPVPAAGLLLAAPVGLLPVWRRRRWAADTGVAQPSRTGAGGTVAPARQLRQPPSSGK